MRRQCALACAAVLTLIASLLVAASPAQAAVGLRVSGRNIVEANGSVFVIRGTSHAHTWYTTQTSSIANIKAKGANAVRVVLSGGRWPANGPSDVANVISLCKASKLICILENHDTTGFGEQSGSVSLDAAVDYWISLQSVLTGEENNVIINIGNEPIGNNAVTPGWTQATSAAIQRMRTAGFQHLLMVDAPNWGQDWSFTMRDNATTVAAADPQRNTVFSVHMYGVFDTAAEITSYLNAFQTAGLPLVIGEFGFNHSDGNPDEDTIMAEAEARGIGYLGWSWSGNGGGVEYLDQVTNFNPNQLTSWGTRLFNGANGIASTAEECTMCGGGTPPVDTTPPTTPGTPTASSVTATGATLSWTASTDSGGSGLAGYNVYRSNGTQLGTSTTNSLALTGLTPSTAYTVYVRARDGAGNLSANSSSVTFTTSAAPSDTTAPTTPGTPTVSGVTSSGASLSWTASTDSGGSGLAGYNVYRSNGTQLATTTTNSVTLTGLTASTAYTVYVRARDGAGNLSANSSSVTFTTTGGTSGGCTATGTVQSQWGNGYVVQPVTVTNGTTARTSWTVTFTLPSGHTLSGSWNANVSVSGQTVTATNMGYNGALGSGASTSFGFQVSRPNGNTATVTSYTCA
ncbi:cellulase family glycosylhydrolase [Herbidospora cretacea]|uniref:cellulase family glycosylhydrolase n=1 Tax=Herbidospora cretacea TaxID=28444 RepID=UPI0004C3A85A|nr:cellulase family glycosylhydrolase [Herbidospora cretacea]